MSQETAPEPVWVLKKRKSATRCREKNPVSNVHKNNIL
jgi:hypothetical protein